MPVQPRRKPRPTNVIQWLVVAGVLLTGLFVARAASLGLDLVTDGPTTRPDWTQPPRSGSPFLPIRTPTAGDAGLPETPPESPGLFIQAGLRVIDAALIVCAVLLVIGATRMWRRTGPSGPPAVAWHGPHGVPTPLEIRTLLSTALEADDILDGAGSPRNAIVECWVSLERIGTDAGVPRHRADTTTEYVVRLMELAEADPEGVGALARLFREARFSEHEVTADVVETARAALRAIRVSLRSPAWTGPSGPASRGPAP